MTFSNYAEAQVGEAYFRHNGSVSESADLWVQLHDDWPSEAGTVAVISGVARQQATFGAFSAGSAFNTNNIAFGGFASTKTVRYISYWDASTGGNCIGWAALGSAGPRGYSANDTDDTFTSPNHGLLDGDVIMFTGEDTIDDPPPPVSEDDTFYYVRDKTTHTFKIAATSGGSAINLTDKGSGTFEKVQEVEVDSGEEFVIPINSLMVTIY